MLQMYLLVYTNGIDPYIAHRAFLLIDEYQTIIKSPLTQYQRAPLGQGNPLLAERTKRTKAKNVR